MRNKVLFLLMIINIFFNGQSVAKASSNPKKVISKSEEANVILYATEVDGMYEGFEMKIGGGIKFFPFWINVTNPTYAPIILYNDLNHDGKKDLIFVLTKGYGTGVLDSEVHVLHKIQTNIGENYHEVLVDNPIAVILKNVKTKLTQHKVKVTIGGKTTVINIDKFQIPPEHMFNDVGFGSIIKYDVVDHQLVASIPAQITPAMFIGSVEITYEFKDKMYQAKKIDFKSE
ncbi:hypothetical protein ACIQXV_02970 [Neobacillus sp. NPDC097160]|uniref:hypothetical protein n=1 Tax=Neobacillus sp. NPDC097160 TaxID=3364298 RepID=UPI00382C384F